MGGLLAKFRNKPDRDERNAAILRACECPESIRSVRTFNRALYCSACFPNPTPRVVKCIEAVEKCEAAYDSANASEQFNDQVRAFNEVQKAYSELVVAVRMTQA